MSLARAFPLALALLHCGSAAGVAHVGDRLLLIPELTDEDLLSVDVHDGQIDEWFGLVGEPVATDADFKRLAFDRGEPSMQFRVWLGWHAGTSRIYAAVQTVDDIYVNVYTTEPGIMVSTMFQNDTFLGIGVDGDHSGDEDYITYVRPEKYQRFSQEYHALGVADGSPQVALEVGMWWLRPTLPFADGPPYSDAGGTVFSEQPVVSITEAYITAFDDMDLWSPEASRRSNLEAGRIIGLALKVTDADAGPVDVQGFYLPLGDTYYLPNRWGQFRLHYDTLDSRPPHSTLFADALLLPAREADDGGLGKLATDSWARIKAQYMAQTELGPGAP